MGANAQSKHAVPGSLEVTVDGHSDTNATTKCGSKPMRHAREERTSIGRLQLPKAAPYNVIGDPGRSYSLAQTERDLHRWEGEGGALGPSAPESARRYFNVPSAVAFPAAGESSDYVIDTIAPIEMQRQLMVNEAGIDVARNAARTPITRPRLRRAQGRGGHH
jgi:hypothetical protein